MIKFIFIAFFFTLGAAIGSFLNVVIWRLPRGESIATPPSHCPKCGARIKWYHNIPILSFLYLRGKCAYCGAPISFRYPLVEFVNAAAYAVVYIFYGNIDLHLLVSFFLISDLIAVFLIDAEHRIIPDSLNYLGMAVGVAVSPFISNSPLWGFIYSLGGLIIGGGIMWLVGTLGGKLFKKEALGGGDVKLMAFLGAFLGPAMILFTIFISALIGVIGGGIMMLFSKKIRKEHTIPFGPYIAIAGLIAFFWGDRLIELYQRLMSI